MSEFIERVAEESEQEDSVEEELELKKEDEDEEEEENTEDQDEQGNLRRLIDDGDEEEEEDEEAGGSSDSEDEGIDRNRQKRRNYEVDDDDLDLVEENLGVKFKRRKKYERLKTMDDDEEDDNMKDSIADEIFTGDGGEPREREAAATAPRRASGNEGEDEESDIDDFIVDDDGQPITKRRGYTSDAALQQAQDIFFGGDFDADFAAEREARRSILELYEPSELESSHLTKEDNVIRSTDVPERFQLRSIPVRPAEDDELEEEARWIFRHGFTALTISMQKSRDYVDRGMNANLRRKGPSTIDKIKEALNFMRNQHFEVPFIAFYRKEYVEPELNLNDLWRVWQWDEKWTQLKTRKQNLMRLFQRMQSYQFERISADPEKPLADGIRPLDSTDMERLKDIQTLDELTDVYNYFLLYYSRHIPKIRNSAKVGKTRLKKIKEVSEDGEEEELEVEEEEEEHKGPDLKQASRKNMYSICQSVGLDGLAKKFGLTPEKFGVNLQDCYQRHEAEQFQAEPMELAKDYVCSQFTTPEAVLEGTRYMVALQIAREPLVRQVLRQRFQERAMVNIKPTKKGKKEIDEAHFAYPFKYLKNKPVKTLNGDQFLKMCLAEEEGLLTMNISIDMIADIGYPSVRTYFDEIKHLYYRDAFSHLVQEWNGQRALAIEMALAQFLYPQMSEELKNKLVAEAKEHVVQSCSRRLYHWLKVAPYRPDQLLEDDDLMDESHGKGVRVLGVAYASSRDTPVFCALIDGEGKVIDILRLSYFMMRRNSFREDERERKANDIGKLRAFLNSQKPHVVAVAGENRDAQMIIDDIRRTIAESSLSPVAVELVDNHLATLYMNSKKSEVDFRDYPPLLRQAVSIARVIQDPLVEYAHVCGGGEDVLCLKLHPLQEHVVREELLGALHCEFINRVNEVGVDVNRATCHPHTQGLLPYVCGLGPRKASHLLKALKQSNARLENRTQLHSLCHVGPKVFTNSAGFVRIDTVSLEDSTESYIEVLDGSRVHPEMYEWARKMAMDAMGYDESVLDANPAGALEEIVENPDHLKDLDLDDFAEELERQGYGNNKITLYDIRAELSCRYRDLRIDYRAPNTEEVFNLLTKETPETFNTGKLITSTVTSIVYKRAQRESCDQAIRNDHTGLWQCPLCLRDNFPDLGKVWNHFDSGSCPGNAIGVRTRLDNGVQGFIPKKFLSDKVVTHPEERVKVSMMVHCRIMKIDIERFSVDLTCRTSDLMDKSGDWRLPRDVFYDFKAEAEDERKDGELEKKQQRMPYVKRVIDHPNFRNVTFKQAEKMMESMGQGELVFRPSSKGVNHLTVTWKVADGICQHVNVREEGKENDFSLGQTLWISTTEFEDLDEITDRYVRPMAAFALDLLRHKNFRECNGGDRRAMEELLVKTKREKPAFIPYFISACRDLPGKFMLGYHPRGKPRVEYVTVTPDGFWYRSRMFTSVNGLFGWIKDHYKEPLPSSGNRTSGNSGRTRTPTDLTRATIALPCKVNTRMCQKPEAALVQCGSGRYNGRSGERSSSAAYHVFATPQQPTAAAPPMFDAQHRPSPRPLAQSGPVHM